MEAKRLVWNTGTTSKNHRNNMPSSRGVFTGGHLLLKKDAREARGGKFHTSLLQTVKLLSYKC